MDIILIQMWRLLLILMAVALMHPISLKAQNTKNKMEQIFAIELYNAYTTDVDKAIKQYEMKTMLITGIAVKVGPDVYGLPSVEVASKEGEKCKTLCVLPFTDYLKLRKVSKCDRVVIQGEVRGYTNEYDLVVIKKCKIVSANDKKL